MRQDTKSFDKLAGAIAFMTLAAVFLLDGCSNDRGRQDQPPPPEVAVVTIEPQPFELTTTLPGRTSAFLVAEIRPQVNGIIQRRHFQEGSKVEAGQLLYQIEPAPFQAALDNARAGLSKAEAHLFSTRLRAERYHNLLADKAISRQDYDDAVSAEKQARAEVEYWKALVAAARIDLGYTSVTAPISGRIGKSSVTDGALVTAYQPTALATIQQLNPIYVDMTQSSADFLRLRRSLQDGQLSMGADSGQKIRLLMEDGTPYPLEGTLQFADVTVDPTTGSFILRAIVPNPEQLLLPGMFVRGIVKEGTVQEAILVPQQGVGRNPKGEATALVVDEAGVIQQRLLTLDRAIGDQWLVTAGLAGGERLIVEGFQRVRPGMTVKTVPFAGAEAGRRTIARQETQPEQRGQGGL